MSASPESGPCRPSPPHHTLCSAAGVRGGACRGGTSGCASHNGGRGHAQTSTHQVCRRHGHRGRGPDGPGSRRGKRAVRSQRLLLPGASHHRRRPDHQCRRPCTARAAGGGTATVNSTALCPSDRNSWTIVAVAYQGGAYAGPQTVLLNDAPVTDSNREVAYSTSSFAGNRTYELTATYSTNDCTFLGDTSDPKYVSIYKYGTSASASASGSNWTRRSRLPTALATHPALSPRVPSLSSIARVPTAA